MKKKPVKINCEKCGIRWVFHKPTRGYCGKCNKADLLYGGGREMPRTKRKEDRSLKVPAV